MKRYEKTHGIKMDVCVLMLQKIFRQGINSIIIMLFLEFGSCMLSGFRNPFFLPKLTLLSGRKTKGLISNLSQNELYGYSIVTYFFF